MGRPKQYDRETVLRRAYETFWAKGYEATSMRDLLDTMQLNRGSLYADFEDKRSLFLEALRQYRSEVVQKRLDAMQKAPSAREAIRGFFDALVSQCRPKSGSAGCLATNSAAEGAVRDPAIGTELAAGMHRMEGVFVETLRRGVAAGEFPADLPLVPTARYLLGLAQGVNVLSRVIPERDFLTDIVETAMRALE